MTNDEDFDGMGHPMFKFYFPMYLLTKCDECGETEEYGYVPDSFSPFIQKLEKHVDEKEMK